MMVGRLLSYWEGIFSGSMLNFGGVPGTLKLTASLHLKMDGWKMISFLFDVYSFLVVGAVSVVGAQVIFVLQKSLGDRQ